MDNKYLILVEGPTDREIISNVLGHVLPNDINSRVHYYVCNGYYNILSSIRPFLDNYDQSIKLIAIIDADTESHERIAEKLDFVKDHVNYESFKDRLEIICFAPTLKKQIETCALHYSDGAIINDKTTFPELINNNINSIAALGPFKQLVSFICADKKQETCLAPTILPYYYKSNIQSKRYPIFLDEVNGVKLDKEKSIRFFNVYSQVKADNFNILPYYLRKSSIDSGIQRFSEDSKQVFSKFLLPTNPTKELDRNLIDIQSSANQITEINENEARKAKKEFGELEGKESQ